MARVVGRDRQDPVVIVGHSLGGLVALRLAVDDPGLAAALLLLDPTPLTPSTLRLMAISLRVFAGLGPVGRRLWAASAGRELRDVPDGGEQQRAVAIYTEPSFITQTARWARYLVRDGRALAEDLAAGRLARIRTTIVSAGHWRPTSAVRRSHQQLVEWIAGAELQVWDDTTHPVHIQRPAQVAELALALLRGA